MDGKRIIFHSQREGNDGIYAKAADGMGKDEPLDSVAGLARLPSSWSGDGKTLIVVESRKDSLGFDIGDAWRLLVLEGDRKDIPILETEFSEADERSSPDMQNLRRLSRETGGAYFEVTNKKSLEQIFETIEEELRSQYSLGYEPDPKARKGYRIIKVGVRKIGMLR